MKKIVTLLFAFMLVITVAGCGGNTVTANKATVDAANPDSIVVREPVTVTCDSDDEDTGLDSSEISFITFEGDSIIIGRYIQPERYAGRRTGDRTHKGPGNCPACFERRGYQLFRESGNGSLSINGGYIVVNAGGDGLDCNGAMSMTDGVVVINGPTNSGNGALDYLGDFKVTGGFIVAAGSSGMAQAPAASSTQYAVLIYLSSALEAGTMIHIGSGDGDEVLTFVPEKTYGSVAFSSPGLKEGTTYNVYSGCSSTGTVTDGLYSGGTYTPGTLMESFTVSDTVTTIGTPTRGGFGGGPPAGGGRR